MLEILDEWDVHLIKKLQTHTHTHTHTHMYEDRSNNS